MPRKFKIKDLTTGMCPAGDWTSGDKGPDQLTPELKSIVQEVVDRPDWLSGNALMVLIDGSGKRKAKSYNATANKSPKLTIDYLLPGNQPETVYYYHNDHLGTPQAMTAASGNLVWQADYKPFGEANVHTETIVNNLRFPGQYYDAESGLHYNYFREYDPGIGRYVESDPIGLAGGMNTYSYAGNSPLKFIDPEGRLFFVPVVIGGLSGSSGLATTFLGGSLLVGGALAIQSAQDDEIPSPVPGHIVGVDPSPPPIFPNGNKCEIEYLEDRLQCDADCADNVVSKSSCKFKAFLKFLKCNNKDPPDEATEQWDLPGNPNLPGYWEVNP